MIKEILISSVLFGGVIHITSAQILVAESRASIKASYQVITPMGNVEATKGQFTFPALFANFDKANGVSIQFEKRLGKSFILGLRGGRVSFSDWNYNVNADVFADAGASISSLSGSAGIRTKFHETGMLNKLHFSVSVSPGYYFIAATFPNAINQQVGVGGSLTDIYVESTTGNFGLLTNVGIEYAISNSWGLAADCGFEFIPGNSSVIYMEESIQWLHISAGITYRLQLNKDYLRTVYE